MTGCSEARDLYLLNLNVFVRLVSFSNSLYSYSYFSVNFATYKMECEGTKESHRYCNLNLTEEEIINSIIIRFHMILVLGHWELQYSFCSDVRQRCGCLRWFSSSSRRGVCSLIQCRNEIRWGLFLLIHKRIIIIWQFNYNFCLKEFACFYYK
jgi:hypothetical protein